MQLNELHPAFDRLQLKHGDKSLRSIYGAGYLNRPRLMFVFMNPTAKNVAADKKWQGLRAPWLGTKPFWKLAFEVGILSERTFLKTKELKANEWSPGFSEEIYRALAQNKVYVTNLAKCTQVDARLLSNNLFRDYLELMLKELILIKPKAVVSFGNQVSSILLGKQVSVKDYAGDDKETFRVGGKMLGVYPVYYPVGQGMRNMPLAMRRIRKIISVVE